MARENSLPGRDGGRGGEFFMLNNFFGNLTIAFMDMTDREEGQGLVEYALILVLISIVSIGLMATLGGKIGTTFSDVTAAL
jgi:pilus assembly protein Flp/PilA